MDFKKLTIAVFLCGAAVFAREVKIAAVANGDIITSLELERREALITELAKDKNIPVPAPEILRAQVLDAMIDDLVKSQEAAKFKLGADESEIAASEARFAQFYGLAPEELRAKAASLNAGEALRSQLKADVLWSKMTYQVLRNYITATDDEANGIADHGNTSDEFVLAAFVFNTIDETKAREIAAEAKSCDEFAEAARADGIGISGEKITILSTQMQPELRERAIGAAEGEILEPLANGDESTIFFVCSRQEKTVSTSDEERQQTKWNLLGAKLDAFQNRYFDRIKASANIKTECSINR
jgi:parvulin-like peptidyl-prolyl isomerase